MTPAVSRPCLLLVACLALPGCGRAPAPAVTPAPAPPVTLATAPVKPDTGSLAVHCGTPDRRCGRSAEHRCHRRDPARPHRGAGQRLRSAGRHAVPRSRRLHLPARPDRHAHAPDGPAPGLRRPARVLHAHAGGTVGAVAGERAGDAAGWLHHGAQCRHLHRLVGSVAARRDQPGRCPRSAHADRRLLPHDSRRRRRPANPGRARGGHSRARAPGRGARARRNSAARRNWR